MTDKPQDPEQPDEAAFDRTLRNLLTTPHKPHDEKKGREPKPAPPPMNDLRDMQLEPVDTGLLPARRSPLASDFEFNHSNCVIAVERVDQHLPERARWASQLCEPE